MIRKHSRAGALVALLALVAMGMLVLRAMPGNAAPAPSVSRNVLVGDALTPTDTPSPVATDTPTPAPTATNTPVPPTPAPTATATPAPVVMSFSCVGASSNGMAQGQNQYTGQWCVSTSPAQPNDDAAIDVHPDCATDTGDSSVSFHLDATGARTFPIEFLSHCTAPLTVTLTVTTLVDESSGQMVYVPVTGGTTFTVTG